jgi:hypothetical protein
VANFGVNEHAGRVHFFYIERRQLSAAHDDLPTRVCYFDGANTNLDRDLEIFLDLAKAYQKRKRHQREYPAFFK